MIFNCILKGFVPCTSVYCRNVLHWLLCTLYCRNVLHWLLCTLCTVGMSYIDCSVYCVLYECLTLTALYTTVGMSTLTALYTVYCRNVLHWLLCTLYCRNVLHWLLCTSLYCRNVLHWLLCTLCTVGMSYIDCSVHYCRNVYIDCSVHCVL